MTASPTCTVYFDGDCPVCRTEIAHYRRQRGAQGIAWVDASSCDEGALGPGLDRATVLSRFHVREADGTLASGAAAFVVIWRRLPAFAWLATLASFPPVLAVLDAGYWLFLRLRPWWRPAHTGALPRTLGTGIHGPVQEGRVDSQLSSFPSGNPDTFPAVAAKPGDPA